MKLPNGYGSISKVKNRKLRKPWCVRVTVGFEYNDKGKYIQKKKLLGYFEDKPAALQALSEYNNNRYNLDFSEITFEECWKRWLEDKETKSLSDNTLKGYTFVYNTLPIEIKERKISELKLHNYQKFFNEYDRQYNTKRKIKNTLKLLYKYLIMNEYTTQNIPENIDLGKSPRSNKNLIFTDEEVEKLWNEYENGENEWIGTILLLIYSGVRISELLNLKTEDIHIEKEYFDIVDSKTAAGVRKVPIHSRVMKIVYHWLNYNTEYFISINKLVKKNTYVRSKMTYRNYRDSYWNQIIKKLNLNEELTPHNARKTCVSMMTKAKIPPYYIKLIIGHEGAMDLTERVYTHIDIKELIDSINLI